MAKYDHGGGCPCGLSAECSPDCLHYNPTQESTKVSFSRQTKESVSPQLKELGGRLQKLSYREMTAFSTFLFDSFSLQSLTKEKLVESLLKTADHLQADPK